MYSQSLILGKAPSAARWPPLIVSVTSAKVKDVLNKWRSIGGGRSLNASECGAQESPEEILNNPGRLKVLVWLLASFCALVFHFVTMQRLWVLLQMSFTRFMQMTLICMKERSPSFNLAPTSRDTWHPEMQNGVAFNAASHLLAVRAGHVSLNEACGLRPVSCAHTQSVFPSPFQRADARHTIGLTGSGGTAKHYRLVLLRDFHIVNIAGSIVRRQASIVKVQLAAAAWRRPPGLRLVQLQPPA